MTREEAREILTHNWTRVDNPNYSESELDEAFFMAIEALQKEADKLPRAVKLTKDIKITLDEEAYEIGYTHGQMADRPKGEWIKKQVFNPELDKYVPLIECSVCGYEPYFGGSESKFNYCANCGARMEK